ncbi:TPA: biotin/lipoyl-binding protein [Candidatus Avigastranaerophilus faecigallinarum]|nr:biotin/lipoyl-binding protein [Candidatus Avigastranaerophilus faecigallinarum]
MKEFETDYIEKLIDIMKNNELTEITLEDSNKSLIIKGNGFKPVIKEKVVEEEVQTSIQEEKEIEQQEEKKNLVPIISNMIGLYFSKPSPNEKPFVRVGDEVKAGQTVCIIETIKLMNKITSDVSGKIAEICIEDGKPVEYGQVIMYVEQE